MVVVMLVAMAMAMVVVMVMVLVLVVMVVVTVRMMVVGYEGGACVRATASPATPVPRHQLKFPFLLHFLRELKDHTVTPLAPTTPPSTPPSP